MKDWKKKKKKKKLPGPYAYQNVLLYILLHKPILTHT